MASHNWPKIKNDYLNGMSLKDVAQKYGISQDSLYQTASKNKWSEMRNEEFQEISEKLKEKRAKRFEFMAETEIELKQLEKEIGMKLIDKIHKAIDKKKLTPYQVQSLSTTFGNVFARLYKSFNISDKIDINAKFAGSVMVKFDHKIRQRQPDVAPPIDSRVEKTPENMNPDGE